MKGTTTEAGVRAAFEAAGIDSAIYAREAASVHVTPEPLRDFNVPNVGGTSVKKALETGDESLCMAEPEFWKAAPYDYRRLLGRVLDALDMSIPNKQQHAAATRQVRGAFDAMYSQMLHLTYPGSEFGWEGCYAVEPLR